MTSSDSHDGRPLPRAFVLELTRGCNYRCRYCYAVWQNPELGYLEQRGELTTGQIKQLVTKLQSEAPVTTIALSGGEPTLRRDLPEIVSFLVERRISPVVITNGSRLTPELVGELPDVVTFEVTLLSYRPEVHDELVGWPGAWRAVIDGMNALRKADRTFVAVFVASRKNCRDLETTAELAVACGASGLMYNRLNLSAHNFSSADQLLPDPASIQENLDALERIAGTYDLPMAVSVVVEPCVVDVSKYEKLRFGWCPLAGKDSYFTIDPAGNLRICNHSPVILGNLFEESFAHIYYHHPYVREFRDAWPEECRNCRPEWKEICRGGCKAAAEQCYGTIRRVDPFVTLSRMTADSATETDLRGRLPVATL